MDHLYRALAAKVDAWGADDYPARMLCSARYSHTKPTRKWTHCACCARPQMRALETYWYLRVVEHMPRVHDLYLHLLQRKDYARKLDLIAALDVPCAA